MTSTPQPLLQLWKHSGRSFAFSLFGQYAATSDSVRINARRELCRIVRDLGRKISRHGNKHDSAPAHTGGKAHATHRMFNPQHPSALTCFLGDISNAKQIDNRVAPKVIGIAGADSHAAGAVIERVSSPGSYFSTSDCRGNRTVLLLAALRFDFAGAAGAGSFIPVS